MGFVFAPLFAAIGVSGPLASLISGFVLAAGALLLTWLLAPKPPKPDDGKITVQQTTPPRNFGYGIARTSGVFLLKETLRGSTLYYVQAIASHRIEAFLQFFLHEDAIALKEPNGDRWATVASEGEAGDNETDGRYGDNKILLHWRFGQTPEDNITQFSDELSPQVWPYSARGDGIAQIAMRAADADAEHQSKRFPNGAPVLSVVAMLAQVWDPRDANQSPDNPQSWKWSRNSALCVLHWLCFSEFGYRRDYRKAVLPILAEWKQEADICDERVPTADGGYVFRYECGGTGTTDNEPKTIMAFLLATCDGWLVHGGDGTSLLRVGKFRPSGNTITDDDIIGFRYQTGINAEDAVNRLDVQFNSPDHKYAMTEAEPWDNEADQQQRGRVAEQQYQLEWVQDYRQARRIAWREFSRLQEPFRGSLSLRLSAINAVYDRWPYCASDSLAAFSNVYIEVRSARFDLENGAISIDFVGHPVQIEDWSPAMEGARPPVLYEDDQQTIGFPANVAGALVRFITDQGPPVTYGQRLSLSWDVGDPRLNYEYAVRWRTQDVNPATAAFEPGPWQQQQLRDPIPSGDLLRYTATTGVVDAASTIEFQMASVKGSTYSDWSPLKIITP